MDSKKHHNTRAGARFSFTYQCTTPESVEQGDLSEHGWFLPYSGFCNPLEDESGYHEAVLQAAQRGEYDVSLSEALSEAQDLGCTECYHTHTHPDTGRVSFSVYTSEWQDTDFRTGEKISHCLHVKGVSPGTAARILRYLGARR